MEEAVIDDGRMTGSFLEVLFATMKVSPLFSKVLMFARNVLCNTQRDVHREVITVRELFASGARDNRLLCRD
eukprot:13139414-Ditylum_brightwellii.AAC.1